MWAMRIGLMHPGEMGAAVGGLLVGAGHDVVWLPSGRSEQTAARARAARLAEADRLDDCEVVLSICPPHAAEDVARQVPPGPALVVDANAISPARAAAVHAILGDRAVDGGIVGAPPAPGTGTQLYLSGRHADRAAALFDGTALETVVLGGSPYAASALKMVYAAWTKGTAALVLAIRETARAEGVEDALLDAWRDSRLDLEQRHERAVQSATTKGWRWVAEMREIAATLEAGGQPGGFHEAAAQVYERYPRPG